MYRLAVPAGRPVTTPQAKGLEKAAQKTDAKGIANAQSQVADNERELPEFKGKAVDRSA